jgi:hypothetical protein
MPGLLLALLAEHPTVIVAEPVKLLLRFNNGELREFDAMTNRLL